MSPLELVKRVFFSSAELAPRSEAERAVVTARVAQFRVRALAIYLALGQITGLTIAVGAWFFAGGSVRVVVCAVGIVSVLMITLCQHLARRGSAWTDVALIATECFVIGFFAYRLHVDLVEGWIKGGAISASILLYGSSFFFLLSPTSPRWLKFQLPAYFLIGALAIGSHPVEGRIWYVTYVLGVLSGIVFKMGLARSILREAVRDARTLAAIAPSQIVRRSLETGIAPNVLFRARNQVCVCVSSDWRGYQQLSGLLAPELLAATLAAYYAMCERLLLEVAPEGNYFSDWIADELFVVFYGTDDATTLAIGRQALSFAKLLVVEKQRFAANHPAPRGIDVGVCFGMALVGILGANGLNKATAVGETPARSRRLQLVAKSLRKTLGDDDRIVLGAELAGEAPEAAAIPPGAELRVEDDCRYLGRAA